MFIKHLNLIDSYLLVHGVIPYTGKLVRRDGPHHTSIYQRVFRSLPDRIKQIYLKCPHYVGKYGRTDEKNVEKHYVTSLFFIPPPLDPKPLLKRAIW